MLTSTIYFYFAQVINFQGPKVGLNLVDFQCTIGHFLPNAHWAVRDLKVHLTEQQLFQGTGINWNAANKWVVVDKFELHREK